MRKGARLALILAVAALAIVAFAGASAIAGSGAKASPSSDLRSAVYSGPTIVGGAGWTFCADNPGAETWYVTAYPGDLLYVITLTGSDGPATIADSNYNVYSELNSFPLSNDGDLTMTDWLATANSMTGTDTITVSPPTGDYGFVASDLFEIAGSSGTYPAAFSALPNNVGATTGGDTFTAPEALPASSLVFDMVGFNTTFTLGGATDYVTTPSLSPGVSLIDYTGDCGGDTNELQLTGLYDENATGGYSVEQLAWAESTPDWGGLMEVFLPAGCEFPWVDSGPALTGNVPASLTLYTITGDLLVVLMVSAMGTDPTQYNNAPSDGRDTFTLAEDSVIQSGTHYANVSLWTATAAASVSDVIVSSYSGEWTTLTGYDIAPLAGDSVTYGPISAESGGSLAMSADTGVCSLVLGVTGESYNGVGVASPAQPPAPEGWAGYAYGSWGAGSVAAGTAYINTPSAGTYSSTWTAGNSGLGAGALVIYGPTPGPAAPTAFSATATATTTIHLAWTNPAGPLTGNNVTEWAGSGCTGGPLDTFAMAPITSFDATGLSPGTEYSFEVNAANSAGGGPYSSCESATTFDPAPGAPTGVVATAESTTEIDVSWTNPSGTLTDNHVYEYAGGSCAGSPLLSYDEGGVTGGPQPMTGLTPSTEYSFNVTASTTGGQGTPSSCVHATTQTSTLIPPTAPTGLAAVAESSTSILVNWTPPIGEALTNAHVYEYSAACASLLTTYSPGSGATTYYLEAGLNPGTSYCFTVAVVNGSGTGPDATPFVNATTLEGGYLGSTLALVQQNISGTSVRCGLDYGEFSLCPSWYTFESVQPGDLLLLEGIGPVWCIIPECSPNVWNLNDTMHDYWTVLDLRSADTQVQSDGLYSSFFVAYTIAGASGPDTVSAGNGFGSHNGSVDNWTWVVGDQLRPLAAHSVVTIDGYSSANIDSINATSSHTVTNLSIGLVTHDTHDLLLVMNQAYASTWFNGYCGPCDNLNYVTVSNQSTPSIITTVLEDHYAWPDTAIWTFMAGVGGAPGATAFFFNMTSDESQPIPLGSMTAMVAIGVQHGVPPAPTDLVATPYNTTQIDLTWVNPVGPLDDLNVTTYAGSGCVYGDDITNAILGVITAYDWTGLVPNSPYSFTVNAENSTGWSAPSDCASATTFGSPPAPTDLVATPYNTTQIDLTWVNPVGPLDDLNVTTYAGSGCVYGDDITNAILGVITAYDWTGLVPNSPYSFTVNAENSTGWSAPSDCASATTFGSPPAPTDLVATPYNTTQIDLTWVNPVGPLDDLNVTIYAGSGCVYGDDITNAILGVMDVAGVVGQHTAYDWTGLVPNSPYSFTVNAENSTGWSAPSDCASATTPPVPPTLTVANVTFYTFNESWTAGNWTNVTGAYLVLTFNASICGSVVWGDTTNSYWTWAVYTGGGEVNKTVSLVKYEFNFTRAFNLTFGPGETVYVGLVIETSDGDHPTAFSCQAVAFTPSPPPGPCQGTTCNIFPLIMLGVVAGVIIFAVTVPKYDFWRKERQRGIQRPPRGARVLRQRHDRRVGGKK